MKVNLLNIYIYIYTVTTLFIYLFCEEIVYGLNIISFKIKEGKFKTLEGNATNLLNHTCREVV